MPRKATQVAAKPRATPRPKTIVRVEGDETKEDAGSSGQDLTLIVSAETLREALVGKAVGHPEYQRLPSGRIMPGTIMDPDKPSKMKVPWTQRDMDEVYGKVTFTPRSDTPVTVNGVRFYLKQDEEITVPSIVKDVYEDHLRMQRRGEAAKRSYFQHVSVGQVPEEE